MDQQITLSGYLWLKCFEYLNQVEFTKCQRVCSRWNNALNQDSQSKAQIFNTFIVLPDIDPQEYFQWFLRNSSKMDYFNYYDLRGQFQLQNLQLLLKRVKPRKLKLAFRISPENHISYITDENLQITHLCIHNDFENNEFFKSLSRLNLKSLKIVSDFIDGDINYVPQVERLNLQVRTLPWESIMYIVVKSKDCLKKLIIDGDELSTEELLKIINTLNPDTMQYFGVKYGEQFTEDVINSLLNLKKLKKQWIKISKKRIEIRKARYLPSQSFEILFKEKSLKKLSLAFCETINDSAVIPVFQNSRNLKMLDLSWSQVTNKAISLMFNQCLFIEKVKLVGCKFLDDKCFPQISNIIKDKQDWTCFLKIVRNQKYRTYLDIDHSYCKYELSLYKRLRYLNCTKCDYITDELLYLLKLYRCGIKILNYYSDEIEQLS